MNGFIKKQIYSIQLYHEGCLKSPGLVLLVSELVELISTLALLHVGPGSGLED